MKLFAYFVLLVLPMAIFGQAPEGKWHAMMVPAIVPNMEPGGGHPAFTFTNDSITITFEPNPGDTRSVTEGWRNETVKIIEKSVSAKGDTTTFILKDPHNGKFNGLRVVLETSGRYLLFGAEGSKTQMPTDSLYFMFTVLCNEAMYAKLTQLKDAGTMTKEHFVHLLKKMRDWTTAIEKSEGYEQRVKASKGQNIMFEITIRMIDELENMGYSPMHWSRKISEIYEEYKDPELERLVDGLRLVVPEM